MNPTQKKILAGVITLAAIIISFAWASAIDRHWMGGVDYWGATLPLKLDKIWYSFLIPLSAASFAIVKLFGNEKK